MVSLPPEGNGSSESANPAAHDENIERLNFVFHGYSFDSERVADSEIGRL
jgi:hypothetical protein